jgi:hypothetical protein
VQKYSTAFIPPPPFTLKLETTNITLLYGQRAEIIFTATGEKKKIKKITITSELEKKINKTSTDMKLPPSKQICPSSDKHNDSPLL